MSIDKQTLVIAGANTAEMRDRADRATVFVHDATFPSDDEKVAR